MLKAIILSFISFAFFLIIHIWIFHKFKPQKRFRTLILIAFVSIILYVLLFFIWNDFKFAGNQELDLAIHFVNSIFVLFFICYFYFHLIIVFDSSVTSRIMAEIKKSKEGRLAKDEIKKRYSLEKKFENELEDMQLLDRIKEKDGLFYNTQKGSQHAKIISFLRSYLHIGGHQ